MNKKELIDAVSELSSYSKKEVDSVVSALIECMTTVLAKGEAIVLPGFANLSIKERAARRGRNPKTGEALTIPASKTVQFKITSALKEAINKV